jgi:hypothetical protein
VRRILLAVIAAILCPSLSAVADNFVWKGSPSIFSSWNNQNNWTNLTPGGTDSDGIPDSDDTAAFNANAITSGGGALNLSIATTARLSIAPGFVSVSNGTISNQNVLTFSGSTTSAESLAIIGTVTLNGGGELQLVNDISQILAVSGTSALTNADNLLHGRGYVNVPIANQGIIRADNAVLRFDGPINNSGGTVQIFSGATLHLNSTLTGGIFFAQAGGLLQGGTFDGVTSTGTTTIAPATTLNLQNSFTNQGKLTFAGSTTSAESLAIKGTVTLNGGGELQLVNAQSVIADQGGSTLTNVDNLIHGGNGATIAVIITNRGIVRADNGVLHIHRIDNAGGTLQVQAAGLNPGEFSLVHFGGNATLDGTLDVTFLNGFLPKTGDVLKVLQIDGTLSGDFTNITFRGVNNGFQVTRQFVGGFYQLTALNDATPAPVIISPLSATAVVGQQFIYQIVSMPTATTYNASVLPPGLTINPTTGIISGVPTTAGTSQIVLSASGNGTGTAVLNLTIQPAPGAGPVITSGMSSTGRTGQPFAFQITTKGASAAARVGAGGLPAGLSVDPVTGLITGTPTSDGSFRVTLTVTDGALTGTGTLQLTFTSDPQFPVIVSPQSAPVTPGQNFTYTIVAPTGNNSEPTTFGLIGTLPPGLTFDANTGTISGVFTGNTVRPGQSPDKIDLSGGIVTNVQLFASNSHGTAVRPLIFFLAPTGAVNISTRLGVGTGDNVLIAGFIITGNAPKKVVIRAIGPSLTVPGALQDPALELHDANGLLGSNNNWRDSQEDEIVATSIPPTDNRESAILAFLDPGPYTAVMSGNNSTGIAVVEVYDLGTASLDTASKAQLVQISTRGKVLSDDNVMIGGFIISGSATKVLVRAIGPTLGAFNVPTPLADPTLELRDGNGALLDSNDNWKVRPDGSSQRAEIEATSVPPGNDLESALVRTATAGNYTAIVRGVSRGEGNALVEVYTLQ